MNQLVAAKLTKLYQSETAIIRAVYGKRDSEISDSEWQAATQALRIVGKSKNIGRNEYVWRAA